MASKEVSSLLCQTRWIVCICFIKFNFVLNIKTSINLLGVGCGELSMEVILLLLELIGNWHGWEFSKLLSPFGCAQSVNGSDGKHSATAFY